MLLYAQLRSIYKKLIVLFCKKQFYRKNTKGSPSTFVRFLLILFHYWYVWWIGWEGIIQIILHVFRVFNFIIACGRNQVHLLWNISLGSLRLIACLKLTEISSAELAARTITSRWFTSWRWYQFQQCYELHWGRSKPCHYHISMFPLSYTENIAYHGPEKERVHKD